MVEMGKYSAAEEYYLSLLENKNVIKDLTYLAGIYNELGRIYQQTGEKIKAIECFSKAIDIELEHLLPTHRNLARLYCSLGKIHHEQGDYQAALIKYHEALNIELNQDRPEEITLAKYYHAVGQVNLTSEEVHRMMKKTRNIRNIAILAQTNDEESTLINLLVNKAGIIISQKTDEMHLTESETNELEQPTLIKPAVTSVYYDLPAKYLEFFNHEPELDSSQFLINLIDSMIHSNISSISAPCLSLADGILIVIDCISDVCLVTETILRQAIRQRIKPILFFNNMDHALLDLKYESEDLFQQFQQILKNINTIITTYGDDNNHINDFIIDPKKYAVIFGSTLHGWAFTITQFADIYASKYDIEKNKLMEQLWGDHFFSPMTKKWSTIQEKGSVRGFCQFILNPINQLFKAIMNSRKDEFTKLFEEFNIELQDELSKDGILLLKLVMNKWLPIDDILLTTMVIHLPSPVLAQKYRTELLYAGPHNDDVFLSIQSCNSNGPLMIYISKIIPTLNKSHYYAFGRVFSGIVKSNEHVRLLGPNYIPGKREDLYIKNIQRIVVMMGQSIQPIDDLSCGNICGLIGIHRYLVRTGTITTSEHAQSICMLKTNINSIVYVTVEPTNSADLPKLVEGMKCLVQVDPLVQCYTEQSGEHITACVDELHLKNCLEVLERNYACIPIKVSDPVTLYRETVSKESDRMCLAKSPNKHNRIYLKAQPMPNGLPEDIENGQITSNQEIKARARYLYEKYDYDIYEARNIWCFGPEKTGPNFLIDSTIRIQYLNEIKDYCVSAFQWATKEGVLVEENVRGVRFDIHDVYTSDAIHHGAEQIIPTMRRVLYGSMLTASPRLVEPIYLYEIQFVFVDFTDDLCSNADGQAVARCVFHHWHISDEDPLDESTRIRQVVKSIRRCKGLKEDIPSTNDYLDKL
ncbi:unnamed protein product [Rotaria sp. Silwood1]|nr:unnamed protein product [Rotaria sp. Silwood1]